MHQHLRRPLMVAPMQTSKLLLVLSFDQRNSWKQRNYKSDFRPSYRNDFLAKNDGKSLFQMAMIAGKKYRVS
jgi:hypothetical protein